MCTEGIFGTLRGVFVCFSICAVYRRRVRVPVWRLAGSGSVPRWGCSALRPALCFLPRVLCSKRRARYPLAWEPRGLLGPGVARAALITYYGQILLIIASTCCCCGCGMRRGRPEFRSAACRIRNQNRRANPANRHGRAARFGTTATAPLTALFSAVQVQVPSRPATVGLWAVGQPSKTATSIEHILG
jgi:hypothetical protein